MVRVIPHFNDDLYPRKRAELIRDQLHDPVITILTEHGPMSALEMCYFMRRQHDTRILIHAMGETLRDIAKTGEIVGRTHPGGKYVVVYHMPGDEHRTPPIPMIGEGLPDDDHGHINAYLELYLRYRAIRNNPALAGAPQALIDDLFLPPVRATHLDET